MADCPYKLTSPSDAADGHCDGHAPRTHAGFREPWRRRQWRKPKDSNIRRVGGRRKDGRVGRRRGRSRPHETSEALGITRQCGGRCFRLRRRPLGLARTHACRRRSGGPSFLSLSQAVVLCSGEKLRRQQSESVAGERARERRSMLSVVSFS